MTAIYFRTLRENVADAIRNKIINRELKPGEHIVEMELAKEFQASRGPIREALRQLEKEGLVEYTRNVGCAVKNLTFRESFELYLIRADYEILSVKYMGGKIPPETIKNMEEILEKMDRLDVEHFELVYEYDNELHSELVKMTQLPHLYQLWCEMKYANIVTGYHVKQNREEIVERQYRIHKEIVDACRSKDRDLICRRLSEHYMRTFALLREEYGVSGDEVTFATDFLF